MSISDPCVLILSSLFEPNVNHVVRRLEERGVRWFRFNTESFPLLCRGRLQFKDGDRPHFQLAVDGQVIDSREVASVWYRRQSDPVLPGALDPKDREFARVEC